MLWDISIQELLIRVPVVLFALTVHEFMHGYVAFRCGDDTAYLMGRLTLNPLRHLDLWGTIALMIGPIGWAKPVPVNRSRFRRPKRDNILVSGAGVAANFSLAVLFALVARAMAWQDVAPAGEVGPIVWAFVGTAVLLNFGLAIFNLLPIPPLDGSHILAELLPWRLREPYERLRPYGIFLLFIFLMINRASVAVLLVPLYRLTWFFAGEEAVGRIAGAFSALAAS